MLLDEPLENARYSLNKLSKHYSINFLSARSSMGYNSYEFIPEKLYNLPGGKYFFIMNVYSSKIFQIFLIKAIAEKHMHIKSQKNG